MLSILTDSNSSGIKPGAVHTASNEFCTQYVKRHWHQRPGSGVHDDAITDSLVHNAIWVDTGTHNMGEHVTMNQ